MVSGWLWLWLGIGLPRFDLSYLQILQELDSGFLLGEALFFPEFSTLADSSSALDRRLSQFAREVSSQLEVTEFIRRFIPYLPERSQAVPTVVRVEVELEAPSRVPQWHTPIRPTFHTLRWDQGEIRIAYVVELGIEVLGSRESDFEGLVEREIRAALDRLDLSGSLSGLGYCQRVRSLEVHPMPFIAEVLSNREREQRLRGVQTLTIRECGIVLDEVRLSHAYRVEESLARIAEILGRTRSVLLVGPSGVGKTALLHELARSTHRFGFPATPFWETSGSQLVSGASGYGMWQERCQSLSQEAAKQRAIVGLGNLVELAQVGRGEGQLTGVAEFLIPSIGRGQLVAVTEVTPEEYARLEAENPRLLSTFVRFEVAEPSPETFSEILLKCSQDLESTRGDSEEDANFSESALLEIERLHRRYASYSAFPGRPIRFLRQLYHSKADERITANDVQRFFSTQTGLPSFLLDDAEPLDLAAVRAWFETRLLGQEIATQRVVDLISVTKSRLARPGKPLASLFFAGPTGVGKTELAKCLAEFLFGDRNRLVRFDMSEYADPVSLWRLTGSRHGEEGLLTAKVREQPFGVFLLDEIEKADPGLFDLLLQVLGEGRLTDAAGRVADFTNAVVIMTSNLGAETFSTQGPGFHSDETSLGRRAREHFIDEIRASFRPEFFNRLDDVIPFVPLDQAAILEIAARELDLLGRREGIQNGRLEFELGEGVRERLACDGFDIRYGARPLKRRIEKDLLVPVAEYYSRAHPENLTRVQARLSGDELKFKVTTVESAQLRREAWEAQESVEIRRRFQQFENCSLFCDLVNRRYFLERQEERLERSSRRTGPRLLEPALLKELRRLREFDQRATELRGDIWTCEELELLELYSGGAAEVSQVPVTADLKRALDELLFDLYCFEHPEPSAALLVLNSRSLTDSLRLAQLYRDTIPELAPLKVTPYAFLDVAEIPPDAEPVQAIDWHQLEDSPPPALRALLVEVRGKRAFARMDLERGLHAFGQSKPELDAVAVEVFESEARRWDPSLITSQISTARRRIYDLTRRELIDAESRRRFRYSGRNVAQAMVSAMEALVAAKLEGILG